MTDITIITIIMINMIICILIIIFINIIIIIIIMPVTTLPAPRSQSTLCCGKAENLLVAPGFVLDINSDCDLDFYYVIF